MSPKTTTCPICGDLATAAARPFCGPACRDRDLLQWLGEGYRVPDKAAPAAENADDFGLDSERG